MGVAPSAKEYLRSAAKLSAGTAKAASVLAVGSPDAADRAAVPLPDAAAELAVVSRLYGQSTALTGGGATIEAFESAARRAEVIHFAGHARANLAIPSFLSSRSRRRLQPPTASCSQRRSTPGSSAGAARRPGGL